MTMLTPSQNTVISFFILAAYVIGVHGDDTRQLEFQMDPYLQYRPPFARSLPVQILLTGVVLTLVVVLFIHLVFTAQYHWPLAPVNYVLQLSGVTTLLISLIATIHVVLSASFAESERWPYMLSYIAVNVPPREYDLNNDMWSIAERATWVVMNASTSGLIQITHIQFLTLLYPSRLEGRLIFTLLGPLAVVAAIMQLISINGSQRVFYVATAVRNVCNATLSLLFTIALFIWGVLVNRKQAWRTDGGTAAFGCAALTLALFSSALNLFYIHREDEFAWLPGLMWAVVLWQSFLGWWWWVGAGSGGGGLTGETEDMEEKLKKEAKRESRKREARERRQETKKKAKEVWRGVAGLVTRDGTSTSSQAHSQTNNIRARSRRTNASSSPARSTGNPDRHTHPGSPVPSIAHSATSSFTATSVNSYNTLPRALPGIIHRWYASLRREHVAAAHQQAVERIERIRELERSGLGRSRWPGLSFGSLAWGMRSEERERGRHQKKMYPEQDGVDVDEFEMNHWSGWSMRRRDGDSERWRRGGHIVEMGARARSLSPAEIPLPPSPSISITPLPYLPSLPQSEALPTPVLQTENTRSRSIWWWGPLWQWRLQDSTVYR